MSSSLQEASSYRKPLFLEIWEHFRYEIMCGMVGRAKRGKRPGIVASMEKLGRRRKPEVRGGPSHHLPTSNVQEPQQRNQSAVHFRL